MVKVIEDRDSRILDAAMECAEADGYQWITRGQVASAAGVSVGTINTAYGTMRELKRAVLTAAVERRNLALIAQGLADNHPIAAGAPSDVRRAAAAHLLGAGA
jgi:AcrR family transcriptional regulator